MRLASVKHYSGSPNVTSSIKFIDPGYTVTPFPCNNLITAICDQTNRIFGNDTTQTNGRFVATVAIDDPTIRTLSGSIQVNVEQTTTGASHAKTLETDASGDRVRTFDLSTIYGPLDGLNSSLNDIQGGYVSVNPNSNILTVSLEPPYGSPHTIHANLNCITIDSTPVCV
ncbi:MAG: hypothetical protein ACLGH3_04425 [Actinomycetota bacterium]